MSNGNEQRVSSTVGRVKAAGVRDRLDRPMHDLRISVMDRCNFRCPYCMPKETFHERYRFLRTAERLTFEEIVRIARLSVGLGVRKLRLTGGEPLLRTGLADLVAELSALEGVEDLALTTNGVLLAQHASELKASGLQRVTVSLDSLDEAVFARMSGGFGGLAQVLEGIEAALAAGLHPVKVNAVVQRGINDHTVLSLLERYRGTGVTVRMIEYMDVGTRNHWEAGQVVPSVGAAAARRANAGRCIPWPNRAAATSPSVTPMTTVPARSGSSRRSRRRSAATVTGPGCRPRDRFTPACSPPRAPTCAVRCAPVPATTNWSSACAAPGATAPTATANSARSCARASTRCARSK